MAEGKNNLIGRILFPPCIVFAGIVALWENEGRFNYAQEASDATVIASPAEALPDTTISITGKLDTEIPIAGEYIDQFMGYHVVSRSAEIYAWDRHEDNEGRETGKKEWQHSLEGNSRNRELQQTLRSRSLYPPTYRLGDLTIEPSRIHFVDAYSNISISNMTLNNAGLKAGLQTRGNYFYKRAPGAAGEGITELGDERISYSGVRNAPTASYFGLITGGIANGKQFEISQSFMSAIIQNDGILHHLVNGEREPALQTMKSHFTRLKWIVRGGGTAAIIIGIYMFFRFFVNLLYRIPLLGDVISAGVFLISLVLGLTIAIIVMTFSILIHHPFMVTLPLVLIIGIIVMVKRQTGKSKANVEQALNCTPSAPCGPTSLIV